MNNMSVTGQLRKIVFAAAAASAAGVGVGVVAQELVQPAANEAIVFRSVNAGPFA